MFRLATMYILPSLRPKLVVDLTMLIILLVTVSVFWISDGFQIWAVRTLGFGWIPALIFLISTVMAIRFTPFLLVRYWKWWVIYLSIVLLTIGTLSYVKWDYGSYRIFGLSGMWGQVIAGEHIVNGICRALVIIFLVPLILFPKRMSKNYIFISAKSTRISLGTCRKLIVGIFKMRAILFFSTTKLVAIFRRNIPENEEFVSLPSSGVEIPGTGTRMDDSL